MLVRWVGYDESHNQWVRRSVLEEDVSALVLSYDVDPSVFVSWKSAPKREMKGPVDVIHWNLLYVVVGVSLESSIVPL